MSRRFSCAAVLATVLCMLASSGCGDSKNTYQCNVYYGPAVKAAADDSYSVDALSADQAIGQCEGQQSFIKASPDGEVTCTCGISP